MRAFRKFFTLANKVRDKIAISPSINERERERKSQGSFGAVAQRLLDSG